MDTAARLGYLDPTLSGATAVESLRLNRNPAINGLLQHGPHCVLVVKWRLTGRLVVSKKTILLHTHAERNNCS